MNSLITNYETPYGNYDMIVLAMLIQYMENEGPTNPYKLIFIERKTVKGLNLSILKIL